MIKFVLFDLDDTILNFKQEEKTALTKTLLELGVTPDENILSRYSEINLSQWKLLELGRITRDEVKVGRYQLLFDEFGIVADAKNATSIYEKNLASTGTCFIENAVEIVKALSENFNLYLVSNGSTVVQKGRLDNSGIRKYFKGIYISQTVGVNKPDKRFFDFCFDDIAGFDKSQAVIIGDSLSSDIQGGINAGIKTIWFNHRKEKSTTITPDYEISSLLELPTLLSNI